MRLLLGVICIIICIFIGYKASEKFTLKRKFFSDFKIFNERFIAEVSFSQNSISQIISDKNSDFYNCIKCKIDKSKNFSVKYLSNEELDLIDEYTNNIGKSDKYTQSLFLNSVKGQIDNYFIKSKEDERKYKSLYIKMGFLIGLIILVVLL